MSWASLAWRACPLAGMFACFPSQATLPVSQNIRTPVFWELKCLQLLLCLVVCILLYPLLGEYWDLPQGEPVTGESGNPTSCGCTGGGRGPKTQSMKNSITDLGNHAFWKVIIKNSHFGNSPNTFFKVSTI